MQGEARGGLGLFVSEVVVLQFQLLLRFDARGASAIEYTLILALVALAALGAWQLLGGAVEDRVSCAAGAIDGYSGPCAPGTAAPSARATRDGTLAGRAAPSTLGASQDSASGSATGAIASLVAGATGSLAPTGTIGLFATGATGDALTLWGASGALATTAPSPEATPEPTRDPTPTDTTASGDAVALSDEGSARDDTDTRPTTRSPDPAPSRDGSSDATPGLPRDTDYGTAGTAAATAAATTGAPAPASTGGPDTTTTDAGSSGQDDSPGGRSLPGPTARDDKAYRELLDTMVDRARDRFDELANADDVITERSLRRAVRRGDPALAEVASFLLYSTSVRSALDAGGAEGEIDDEIRKHDLTRFARAMPDEELRKLLADTASGEGHNDDQITEQDLRAIMADESLPLQYREWASRALASGRYPEGEPCELWLCESGEAFLMGPLFAQIWEAASVVAEDPDEARRESQIQRQYGRVYLAAVEKREAADRERARIEAEKAAAAQAAQARTYPGDGAPKEDIARWMAQLAKDAGLPPELPVMAALTESGMYNNPGGDADSVGYFQMRASYWNKDPYTGYYEDPAKQMQWFIDTALPLASQYAGDPSQWGEWCADVENPRAEYRYRYQTHLEEARRLLGM